MSTMRSENTSIYDFKPIYALFALSLIYLMLAYINTEFVMNRDVFYNSLGAKLTIERIDEIISSRSKYQWLAYLFVPAIVLLKITLVAACIYTGVVFNNYEVSFKNIFKVSLLAEIVLILAAIFKLAWLLYKGVNTLEEIRLFYPLSLLQFMNVHTLPSYIIYPVQLINIFEIGYWIVLAIGLRKFLHLSFMKSIRMVLMTYGVGLCLWVVIVIFIQLQFS